MHVERELNLQDLEKDVARFLELAGETILRLDRDWNPEDGAPVCTVQGRYASRGWTEWTQGFQFGCQLLQFDATGDEQFLELGRNNTLRYMAPHVSHTGVHDHGFNNISTYGNLRRLIREGRAPDDDGALLCCEMALKVSGAVQAARWTRIHDGTGYIYSFNGPHSLFSDTIRSCRSLVLAHQLGHCLMGENDQKISLLQRAIEHITNTSRYNVFYGEGRDAYDIRGRVAHEGLFNVNDGNYRCPSTQQGYSPFTTWTRGLAWVLLGAAEQLECVRNTPESEFSEHGGRAALDELLLKMATATADFTIENTARDGIPYWDTGAPGLAEMPDWRETDSQPDNPYEPVDSSAAVVSALGLLRLGKALGTASEAGARYFQAGLTVARTLLSPPYLSNNPDHHGLILHSVYHRPNGWDHVPAGKCVPQREASMWGDYHAMELATYLKRLLEKRPYLTFFDRAN